MKTGSIALVFAVCLAGCERGGPPFSAPEVSEITDVKIYADDVALPDGSVPELVLPQSEYAALIDLLDGAQHDGNPMKWMVLGSVSIKTSESIVGVDLYQTRKAVGAFKSGGEYYRGGSDAGFNRLIAAARKLLSEQGGAEQPATDPELKLEGSEKPKPESEGRSQ